MDQVSCTEAPPEGKPAAVLSTSTERVRELMRASKCLFVSRRLLQTPSELLTTASWGGREPGPLPATMGARGAVPPARQPRKAVMLMPVLREVPLRVPQD